MASNALLWKFGLILAVLAVGLYFSYPPEDRISLGLDLRGGAHILMQVDTDSALKHQLDVVQDRLGQELKEKGVGYEAILSTGPGELEIRGVPSSSVDTAQAILDEALGDWDVSRAGAGTWRVEMPADVRQYYRTSAVKGTLTTMWNRLDGLGVSEPLIQEQGIQGDRILVQLPGVENPERVIDLLLDTARLEWKAVSYPPGVSDFGNWLPPTDRETLVAMFGGRLPPDTEAFVQRTSGPGGSLELWWPLKRVSTVGGGDLKNAFRQTDQWGEPSVGFELTQEAGRRFEVATKENIQRKMAIVLDDEVISAPTIRGTIRDQGVIEGGFSVQEAEDLALKLRSGAIPADVDIIEERTVGPSLGQDSIRRGLTAGIVGLICVFGFMLVYYRLSGLNAVVALLLNVLLVFGALGALPFLFSGTTALRATLTLPGIAGLILTVGMAVDSNVLIFERIREELRLGKTVRSAVQQGFSKAVVTVLDCNITTIVAAVFLGMYGTGPVRGFAVTLIIGLLVSMFTAVFVSRQLFELVLLGKSGADTLSI
jgi:preprotein translocase subunit SecD